MDAKKCVWLLALAPLACAPQPTGDCSFEACDAGEICDPESLTCRPPRTCADVACWEHQTCEAAADADARCLSACDEGWVWQEPLGPCAPATACAELDCDAEHRVCVEQDGLARCDVCAEGYVAEDDSCRAPVTCETLYCEGLLRTCEAVADGDAICGDCLDGRHLLDETTGACRLPQGCADLDCGAQRCFAPPGEDAFCHDGCTGSNGRPGIPDSADHCVNCPTCDGPGEEGPYLDWLTADGECICQTEPHYYWSLGAPVGVQPCDVDEDGWVRVGAETSLLHPDPVINANARCALRRIDRFELVNEAGETLTADTLGLVPLFESERNDDPALLAIPAPETPPYSGGRPMQARELNHLTKACVSVSADFNDNGVEDVLEDQEMVPPPGLLDAFEPFLSFAYFVELHRGIYEPGELLEASCAAPIDCGDELVCDLSVGRCRRAGLFRIAERPRRGDLPVRHPSAAEVSADLAAGCADGTREGFLDTAQHPNVAGCSGGWEVAGIDTAAACDHASGNSGFNPTGSGCAAADLCAPGWRICRNAVDVDTASPGGCAGATTGTDLDLFFATRQSGSGGSDCNHWGRNDLFGCGNEGVTVAPGSCSPLDRSSGELCGELAFTWECGPDGSHEADQVVKTGPAGGGVLCCRDPEVPYSDYWRDCARRRDPAYGRTDNGAGLDFARFNEASSWTGMNHHSQFRCLHLTDLPDQPTPPNELRPSEVEAEGWRLNDCVAADGDQPARNVANAGFVCDPRAAPPEVGVAWAVATFDDYGQVDAYGRGCVNECIETLASCAECARAHSREDCPLYFAAPDKLTCIGDPERFGRLHCGCPRRYGGPSCEVGCPETELFIGEGLRLAPRVGTWLCGHVAASSYPEAPELATSPWRLTGEVPATPTATPALRAIDSIGREYSIRPAAGDNEVR